LLGDDVGPVVGFREGALLGLDDGCETNIEEDVKRNM